LKKPPVENEEIDNIEGILNDGRDVVIVSYILDEIKIKADDTK
jgi:hypothetical protein